MRWSIGQAQNAIRNSAARVQESPRRRDRIAGVGPGVCLHLGKVSTVVRIPGMYIAYSLPSHWHLRCPRKFSAHLPNGRLDAVNCLSLSPSFSLFCKGNDRQGLGLQLRPPPNELTSHTHAVSHLALLVLHAPMCLVPCRDKFASRMPALPGTRPLPGHCNSRGHFAVAINHD